MAISVYDNGDKIKLVNDSQVRFLIKSQIKEINVVRGTIIKIDIGLGTLNCIYLDSLKVTTPASSSASDLRDKLLKMLEPVDFNNPYIVDESEAGVVYKGFAPLLSFASDPVWAIQRIRTAEGITSYEWAGGTKTFDKMWDIRTFYEYR